MNTKWRYRIYLSWIAVLCCAQAVLAETYLVFPGSPPANGTRPSEVLSGDIDKMRFSGTALVWKIVNGDKEPGNYIYQDGSVLRSPPLPPPPQPDTPEQTARKNAVAAMKAEINQGIIRSPQFFEALRDALKTGAIPLN